MKKQLLACMLVLTSITMHNVQASQMASDYLSKFKLLSTGFPNMQMKYDTLRAGCINAAWVAKSPAVQKFVQNNFNMIAATTGCIFAGIVGFALNCLRKSCNDSKFDKQFKADAVFRYDAIKAALNVALIQWTQEPAKHGFEATIPLQTSDRYAPLGHVVLHGHPTAHASPGYISKAIRFDASRLLNVRLVNAIQRKSGDFQLHQAPAKVQAAASSERSNVLSGDLDGYKMQNLERSPLDLLSDDQYRAQLVELLTSYIEQQQDDFAAKEALVSDPMQTIDITNIDPVVSTGTSLVLEDGRGNIVYPHVYGWGNENVNGRKHKTMAALTPAQYLVVQDGMLRQRVSAKIQEESRLKEAKQLGIPQSTKVTLDLGDPKKLHEYMIYNADTAQVTSDWDTIKNIIMDDSPWLKSSPECVKLTRTKSGRYKIGEPQIKRPVSPEVINSPIIFGRPSGAASSSNAGQQQSRGRVYEFTDTCPKERRSMSPTRVQRAAAITYKEA